MLKKKKKEILDLVLWLDFHYTEKHTGFVCTVVFAYPWQVCCGAACVYAFCWRLIKFPIEGFIIFITKKKRKLQAHQSSCLISPFSSGVFCPPCSVCQGLRFSWCSSGPTTPVMSEGHLSPCPPTYPTRLLEVLVAFHYYSELWVSEIFLRLCLYFLFSSGTFTFIQVAWLQPFFIVSLWISLHV